MERIVQGPLERIMVFLTAVGMAGVVGCSSDGRAVAIADRALAEQAKQNQRMAEQSEQVASASRALVEADAAARGELFQASQAAHAEIARGRDDLEAERQAIASQRHRDPIIAETLRGLGVVLACLLPLLLAAYVLYQAGTAESQAVDEVLVLEAVMASPQLALPAGESPANQPLIAAPVAGAPDANSIVCDARSATASDDDSAESAAPDV